MTRWNTDQIVEALKEALTHAIVEKDSPGGDHDTEIVIVRLSPENFLLASGFTIEYFEDKDPADMDVEMVELTDNSGDGLQCDDPTTIRAYAEAMIVLKAMGFTVVPRMKDYF